MTTHTDLTCPECQAPTLVRIHRVFTEDGVVETWQCADPDCRHMETI